MHPIALPGPVAFALSALEAAGFEAFIVGGCVRDALLGRTPQDFDITTNALPQQVEAVFSGARVIETGLKHGTVTVLLENMPLEITTYRVDGGYSDGRHPDQVAFTGSLREDLARRDFTVNAMAYNPRFGLADCFGGQADLQKRVLRCVGNPETRFTEDALRMLRLLRFAARLGFSIEPATAQAALALRERLKQVSAERIQKELTALVQAPGAGDILIEYVDVFGVFLPELLPCRGFCQQNPHHAYDVLTHLARTVDAVPPKPVLRLAALLHDIGKPDCFTVDADGVGHFYGHANRSAVLAEAALTRLRYDNETKTQVLRLIEQHDLHLDPPDQPMERTIRRALNRMGPERFFDLLDLMRADNAARGVPHAERLAKFDRVEALARQLLAEQACFSLRDLAVDGNDLIAAGLPKGREIGVRLNALLDAVIDNRVENEKTALLRWLKDAL